MLFFFCLRCSEKELDEFNHNCDKCIMNYYFEYNTKNCCDNSILERGYYFDYFTISEDELPTYKKCYKRCKTCNNTFIENDMNCILCIDEFYKINGTNNCYNKSFKEEGYYLKNNIFYPCEENCKTCTDSKSIIDNVLTNNCNSYDIAKNLYFVDELNNCETVSYKINGYYLKNIENNNSDLKILYKCYISCSLCDVGEEYDNNINKANKHNCLKCTDDYYPLRNDPNPNNCYNNEETIPL